jgi:hypothetical protein
MWQNSRGNQQIRRRRALTQRQKNALADFSRFALLTLDFFAPETRDSTFTCQLITSLGILWFGVESCFCKNDVGQKIRTRTHCGDHAKTQNKRKLKQVSTRSRPWRATSKLGCSRVEASCDRMNRPLVPKSSVFLTSIHRSPSSTAASLHRLACSPSLIPTRDNARMRMVHDSVACFSSEASPPTKKSPGIFERIKQSLDGRAERRQSDQFVKQMKKWPVMKSGVRETLPQNWIRRSANGGPKFLAALQADGGKILKPGEKKAMQKKRSKRSMTRTARR